MGVDSSEASFVARPITRMKIHERLESKAVDIHIQKMASLTLNGAPLCAAYQHACTTRCTGVAARKRRKRLLAVH